MMPDASDFRSTRPWKERIPIAFGSVLFLLLAAEMGLFLLVFPWTTFWPNNFFSSIGPPAVSGRWHAVWMSPQFRGLVSGLGLLDLYISFGELGRLLRVLRGY